MKTMSAKKNHDQLVEEFLAKGGKIQKIPTMSKPRTTREVKVVEIQVDALPPELAKKYFQAS